MVEGDGDLVPGGDCQPAGRDGDLLAEGVVRIPPASGGEGVEIQVHGIDAGAKSGVVAANRVAEICVPPGGLPRRVEHLRRRPRTSSCVQVLAVVQGSGVQIECVRRGGDHRDAAGQDGQQNQQCRQSGGDPHAQAEPASPPPNGLRNAGRDLSGRDPEAPAQVDPATLGPLLLGQQPAHALPQAELVHDVGDDPGLLGPMPAALVRLDQTFQRGVGLVGDQHESQQNEGKQPAPIAPDAALHEQAGQIHQDQ